MLNSLWLHQPYWSPDYSALTSFSTGRPLLFNYSLLQCFNGLSSPGLPAPHHHLHLYCLLVAYSTAYLSTYLLLLLFWLLASTWCLDLHLPCTPRKSTKVCAKPLLSSISCYLPTLPPSSGPTLSCFTFKASLCSSYAFLLTSACCAWFATWIGCGLLCCGFGRTRTPAFVRRGEGRQPYLK